MTFHEDEHKINNTGWIWSGDETEGWNEANQKGMPNVFSIYIFSIRNEVKDLEFALAKLRGLCKYLANVYKSHSHVYGLHRLILCTKSKAEKSMQWGESSFKRAQRYLNIKYGEVSLQFEFTTLPPKPQPLYETKWKGKQEEWGKCSQTNSTLYNTQGWDMKGRGGREVKG